MGGWRSGRKFGGGRDRLEFYRSVDVNKLRTAGYLTPGEWRDWGWMRDGSLVASISVLAERTRLLLRYSYAGGDGDCRRIEDTVPIAWVACRFGGMRPYLVCPGLGAERACSRRTVKLYMRQAYFRCRTCHRLVYATTCEGDRERCLRWADKIRLRLACPDGMSGRFPPRPSGMWNATYERLREQAFSAEIRAEEIFATRAGHLLRRIERRSTSRTRRKPR